MFRVLEFRVEGLGLRVPALIETQTENHCDFPKPLSLKPPPLSYMPSGWPFV